MVDDELPKDYSTVYAEGSIKPPVPPMRRAITPNLVNTMMPMHQNHQHSTAPMLPHPHSVKPRAIWSDGAKATKRSTESTVDLRAVVAKLENLPRENRRADAMDTLNKHFSSVFTSRRRPDLDKLGGYKAYIQYEGGNEKETYVVRLDRNTLKAVKDKLPKRGNYRYFFKQVDNTCEEVEIDESFVPFHEKSGSKQIYCHVFPY